MTTKPTGGIHEDDKYGVQPSARDAPRPEDARKGEGKQPEDKDACPEPPVIIEYPRVLYKVQVHPPPPPPPEPAPEVEIQTLVVADEEGEKKALGEGWSKDVPKVEVSKNPRGPYVPVEEKPAHDAPKHFNNPLDKHDEKKK